MNYTHTKEIDGMEKVVKRVAKRNKWVAGAIAVGSTLYGVYRYIRGGGDVIEIFSPDGERMMDWMSDRY